MAEFQEVMKQAKRMCENCHVCKECPMDKFLIECGESCSGSLRRYPQQAEEIIMKWAEEHPIKTNADKAKEIFGNDLQLSDCESIRCTDNRNCDDCKHHNFWQQEYKEPKGE